MDEEDQSGNARLGWPFTCGGLPAGKTQKHWKAEVNSEEYTPWN